MFARAAGKFVLLLAIFLLILSPAAIASDRLQGSIAFGESFVPLALLVSQGTDTPFELGVFGASIVLHSLPNTVLLLAERGGHSELTRAMRWVNFGIDAGAAAGLLGFGVAYLAGAFGPGQDTRSRGAAYLTLSIPAALAAFSDLLPYTIENQAPARSEP